MPGTSDGSSPGAKVQSRVVQRLFYCGAGFFRIFPFHTVPYPVAEVNHKTCRTVSAMRRTAVGCQHKSRHHAHLHRTPTHSHPDGKPHPSAGTQLYHQQDVNKDAEYWQEWEERYLQGIGGGLSAVP